MKTYKSVTIQEKHVDTVVCNMCGEEIGRNDFGYMNDHVSIEKQWGYGSPHDGEMHKMDLCQECYTKLLLQMKIPPVVEE